MKIASIADVKAKLSAYVKASGKGPVVITRNGKAVAAIIPLAVDEDLERLLLGYFTQAARYFQRRPQADPWRPGYSAR